jgi:hypothetical protein
MLAGLCRALAAGWEVTVVGRDEAKLARVAAGEPRLHPLSVDYERVDTFRAALDAATASRGEIVLAVCWIRSWAPKSLRTAAAAVAPGGRLVHVIGARAVEASATTIAELARRDDLVYRQVRLGAVDTPAGRRWLTDAEISSGVYAALRADEPYSLVGTVI